MLKNLSFLDIEKEPKYIFSMISFPMPFSCQEMLFSMKVSFLFLPLSHLLLLHLLPKLPLIPMISPPPPAEYDSILHQPIQVNNLPKPYFTPSSDPTPLTSTLPPQPPPHPPPLSTNALRHSTKPKTKPCYLEAYHRSLLASSLHQSGNSSYPIPSFLSYVKCDIPYRNYCLTISSTNIHQNLKI